MKDIKTNVTKDAAVRLMLKFPYWSELYYTMTVYEDASLPTLATDGRNMWVNPTFWKTLTLELKVAALAHEVSHKMLLHCSRRGSRDPMLWNIAADYVVNGMLSQNGFTIGDGWLFDAKYVGWAVEAVYSDLESKATKQPPKSGQGQGQDQDQDQGQSRTYTVPGVPDSWYEQHQDIKNMQGSAEEIDKAEKEVLESVERALMAARAYGHEPGGMEAFEDLVQPSKEPWYNHLHRYMQSLSISEYNWARVNRRHLVQHQLFTPDHYSEALGDVVVAIDTSGSVFDAAVQAEFAGHVNAILAEAKPRRTHVIYFDSRVAHHEELEYCAVDFSSRPVGGGGTDFRPIFEYLADQGVAPEVAIVLTDCYGAFPNEAPEYPVVWASIIDPKQLGNFFPPFGHTIHVDV